VIGTPQDRLDAHASPGDPRPAEDAAWSARMAAESKVLADLRLDLHDAEILSADLGQPSIAVQSMTHGAGMPPLDLGKPVGHGGQS